MAADLFTVTIHMVSSLDGFIAKKDNSISWFETAHHYEQGVSAPNPEDSLNPVDCYVMGARTYEHALELSKAYGWPYGDVPTIVVSHRNLPIERPNISFYSGDLQTLVNDRLRLTCSKVWVVGGPVLVNEFIRLQLADEIRLPILPILLGDGTRFFDHLEHEQLLHLTNVTAYKTGMLELSYTVVKT